MDFDNQVLPQKPLDQPPSSTQKFITVALIVIVSYVIGFQSGKSGFAFQPKDFKIINRNGQPQDVDYNLLWQAIDVVNDKYIEQPVSPQKILYGAIDGAVRATGDQYTDFFEPNELETFKSDLEGNFEGIGAEIGKRNGQIVVIAPLDGTPAKRAGLQPKDIILEVNDEATQDWSVDQAVSRIRGKKSTEVRLTILREGKDAPFEVKIIREKIEIKSVKWEFKDVQGKKIAVITVNKFGGDTKALFDKAVNESLTKGANGVVIDLRNNPGGYLQTAVDLASNWVSLGSLVVKEERGNGKSHEYKSTGNTRLAGMKTVVLINGGSASASEIMGGALHDYGLAKLVGEKTFGKGSVQELVELKSDSGIQGAVKVTVAKWITPSGKNLNKDGLTPDLEVKLTEEDINASKDPQMEKAMEEVVK